MRHNDREPILQQLKSCIETNDTCRRKAAGRTVLRGLRGPYWGSVKFGQTWEAGQGGPAPRFLNTIVLTGVLGYTLFHSHYSSYISCLVRPRASMLMETMVHTGTNDNAVRSKHLPWAITQECSSWSTPGEGSLWPVKDCQLLLAKEANPILSQHVVNSLD